MKDIILKKAIDLFLTFGFKSVTMDDIAKELAISKKTIYTHFSTKMKLVSATTFYVFDQINSGIYEICTIGNNPIKEIYAIKLLIKEQLKGERTSPHYQLQKYYPKIYDTLKKKQFDSVNDCVTRNLKNGIDLGFYREEIDINLITRIYFNGVMGIKNVDLFPLEYFSSTYLMDSYLEYHIRAIATKKGIKTLEKILKK